MEVVAAIEAMAPGTLAQDRAGSSAHLENFLLHRSPHHSALV